jgi:hypothetical protein
MAQRAYPVAEVDVFELTHRLAEPQAATKTLRLTAPSPAQKVSASPRRSACTQW